MCAKILTITFLLIAFVACQTTPPSKVIRKVRYVKAGLAEDVRVRIFSGVTQSGIESKLSFRVSGKLVSLPIEVGNVIKNRQLIARLDPYDYQLKVEEAKTALIQAKSKQRLAISNYNRTEELYETRSASLSDLEAARAEHESATATVQSRENAVKQAIAQLGYAKLHAPFDGEIASVEVELNENLKTGQVVAVIHSTEELEVKVAIPDLYIKEINEGQKVMVTFPTFPDKQIPATVTEVGIASKTATTYSVTVKLNKPDSEILSGMAAEVQFDFSRQEAGKQLVVPSESVIEIEGETYVYIAVPVDGEIATVEKRKIVVGNLSKDGIEVRSGIQEGEYVITAGLRVIKEGVTVRIQDEK